MRYAEILSDIRKIVRSLDLESKAIEKTFGISIPQLLALEHLQHCPDYQTTHRQLTRYLNLNSSTVTGIVNRLEKKGMLVRLPKTGDKRTTTIVLTAAGLKMLEETPSLMQHKLIKQLSEAKDEEIEQITKALGVLTRFLEIDTMDMGPMLTTSDPIHNDDDD